MSKKELPTSSAVASELKREKYRNRFSKTLRSTIFSLITAAAVAVLVASLWLPVLKIHGSSMTPTLQEGEIVVCTKDPQMDPGDVVAFYYGNKVLVKRYIAGPGSWVDIQPDGTVAVDSVVLEEPYISEKAFGICDLELPYQVPDGTYFILGDERASSVDSRHSTVGCVSDEDLIGRVVFRVWPLDRFGPVN